MSHWKAAAAAIITIGLFAQPAQAAAPNCTTEDELSALRTAALQQQLMVAGLTCHATQAYNRFVLAYQAELQKSDAELKAYFTRRGGERGEADYDTFKTKLANLASLSNTADAGAYCANARVSFDMAMRDGQSLASYVASQQLVVTIPEQRLCVAGRQVFAEANTSPATGVNDEVSVPQYSAPPRLSSGSAQVVAVPNYSLPASPYRSSNDLVALAPPPATPAPTAPLPATPAPANYAPQADYAPTPLPPPPPRLPRSFVYGAPAWPPGWGPFPYRWYYGY
jgi:hypothetical protein